jgi:hypothetical protein
VLRRCPTPLTMLVVALACGLGLRPSLTQAASSTPPSSSTYSWTTSASFPALGSNPTGPQIEFLVQPYGSLVPYSSSTGPLAGPISVTPALNSSNQVYVGLKDLPATSTTPAEQFLGLFFSNGLNAGSVLNVPLYYNTSQPPQLIPQTAGVTPYTATNESSSSGAGSQTSGESGGGGGVITNATPEPLSLLIWTALTGVALARVRFQRRLGRATVAG